MRDMMENWKNSKKYREIQEQLAENQQNLIDLKINIMSKENRFTKEELLELIAAYKEIHRRGDKMEFDVNYFSIVGDSDEILTEYISRQVNWFYYLGTALIIEDYEVAAECRDMISIEKELFLDLIKEYRDYLALDPEFIERVHLVDDKLYRTITDNIINKK
jgi:hypothetical protein